MVASEKGVVVGRLTFQEDGDTIDCQRMGVGGKAIPPNIDKVVCTGFASAALAHPVLPSRHRLIQTTPCPRQVRGMRSDAKFILLVEKDAAFMRLAEDRFYNTYPCIIITAKGQPDVATRHVGMACMKAAWTRVVAPKHSARCALVHQRTFLPHSQVVSAQTQDGAQDSGVGAGRL